MGFEIPVPAEYERSLYAPSRRWGPTVAGNAEWISCSSTLYPELCFSAIAESLDSGKKVSSEKDVILLSLNATIVAEQRNYAAIKKLLADGKSNFTEREKTALGNCLETCDETLDELNKAVNELNEYPFKKSIQLHADDLKTLLSSAITNQVK